MEFSEFVSASGLMHRRHPLHQSAQKQYKVGGTVYELQLETQLTFVAA
jgi:hypothetical protein